jgi:hypothetical protein
MTMLSSDSGTLLVVVSGTKLQFVESPAEPVPPCHVNVESDTRAFLRWKSGARLRANAERSASGRCRDFSHKDPVGGSNDRVRNDLAGFTSW